MINWYLPQEWGHICQHIVYAICLYNVTTRSRRAFAAVVQQYIVLIYITFVFEFSTILLRSSRLYIGPIDK